MFEFKKIRWYLLFLKKEIIRNKQYITVDNSYTLLYTVYYKGEQ